MAFGGVIATAVRRAKVDDERRGTELPTAAARRVRSTEPSSGCPEVDCVRPFLPAHIIAAAERRARSIGMGADRVLICADAITEEAYVTALALSLGTSFEEIDLASRADCPLDDRQLVQAEAAGLLPLRADGKIVWVIAPRCLTARRLADPEQRLPESLRSFRLTSSERLWRYVARYTQTALGRQAAEALSRDRPLFSNAPQPHGWRNVGTISLVILGATTLALIPTAVLAVFAALLCAVFLAAAALRLSSAFYPPHQPTRSIRIEDDELPIYTIICALYREANVVGKLAAAIRALDYPGIMAQTPQAFSPAAPQVL